LWYWLLQELNAQIKPAEKQQGDNDDRSPTDIPLRVVHGLLIIFLNPICETLKHGTSPSGRLKYAQGKGSVDRSVKYTIAAK